MKLVLSFIGSILETIYNLVKVLLSSLVNGLEFLGLSLTTIPNFLFDTFNGLPDFFKVGYTGLLGVLLLVAIFKLLSIIKGSG